MAGDARVWIREAWLFFACANQFRGLQIPRCELLMRCAGGGHQNRLPLLRIWRTFPGCLEVDSHAKLHHPEEGPVQ